MHADTYALWLQMTWQLTNSPHKGQWRGAFMFSLICAWINRWVNSSEAGDLRRHRTNYDVIVIECHLDLLIKS